MSEIEEAIRTAYEVMDRHAHLGAWETEPQRVFSGLLRESIFESKTPEVPVTAAGWELDASHGGAEAAARALGVAAVTVLKLAGRRPYEAVEAYLRIYGQGSVPLAASTVPAG